MRGLQFPIGQIQQLEPDTASLSPSMMSAIAYKIHAYLKHFSHFESALLLLPLVQCLLNDQFAIQKFLNWCCVNIYMVLSLLKNLLNYHHLLQAVTALNKKMETTVFRP